MGIKTAQTVWQARRLCPSLILLPPHHKKYRQMSKKINQIYGEYTDLVEPFSVDESWLDVTGSLHLLRRMERHWPISFAPGSGGNWGSPSRWGFPIIKCLPNSAVITRSRMRPP